MINFLKLKNLLNRSQEKGLKIIKNINNFCLV